MMRERRGAILLAGVCLLALLLLVGLAEDHLPAPDLSLSNAGPGALPPFGADEKGRSLLAYAAQGASVAVIPAILAGLFVGGFGVIGGLLRALGWSRLDSWIQGISEVVGALPRMVVLLVVALILPEDQRGLLPIALTWGALATPGAMDEAAAVAERLGGARFVEALKAHGYSAARIYLYHIVALNLRPVVVRQGAEVMMQVVFLEIAFSYLARVESYPSFTHPDSVSSWADLLYLGYPSLAFWEGTTAHALGLGLGLVAFVAVVALSTSHAARAR
jgi:dipeptide transport system permease protein